MDISDEVLARGQLGPTRVFSLFGKGTRMERLKINRDLEDGDSAEEEWKGSLGVDRAQPPQLGRLQTPGGKGWS